MQHKNVTMKKVGRISDLTLTKDFARSGKFQVGVFLIIYKGAVVYY